jgi:hypothetical protein
VLVLENGMKFHEVGVTNRDAQFLELRKFQITDIARLFRVPPHMIADLDRATFSNIEQQSLEFVMHTMTPWAERWEASIESELLLDGDDLEVEFDFANLMRGDAASRSSYYQSGIQNGWLTRNEARIAENLNPLDGLDEPLRPLNMVEEGSAEDLEGDAGQGQLPAQDVTGPQDDDAHRPNDDGDDTMNHHLLIAEFLATPWALMPERLNAVAAVLARWSQDIPAGEDVLASIAADRKRCGRHAGRRPRRCPVAGLRSCPCTASSPSAATWSTMSRDRAASARSSSRVRAAPGAGR